MFEAHARIRVVADREQEEKNRQRTKHDLPCDVQSQRAVMFIGTLRLHVAGQIVFGSLTILFFLLAIGDYTSASVGFKHFTGYEGIFCGFSAIYAGLAQVLNEIFGKTVLPLGSVMK